MFHLRNNYAEPRQTVDKECRNSGWLAGPMGLLPLKRGSSGAAVVVLQLRLEELGFDPGGIDGNFGPGTERAVRAFQDINGLTVDGVVGDTTAAALDFDPDAEIPSGFEGVSVTAVSRMFSPHTPLKNIREHLPNVLGALVDSELRDQKMVLMALSSIRAETEGFEPISERQSKFNTSEGGLPFDKYDNRKDLGNQGPPDGERFKGRGFIQLTGRFNYDRQSFPRCRTWRSDRPWQPAGRRLRSRQRLRNGFEAAGKLHQRPAIRNPSGPRSRRPCSGPQARQRRQPRPRSVHGGVSQRGESDSGGFGAAEGLTGSVREIPNVWGPLAHCQTFQQ